MRQRIVGAIALAGGPQLIIADEPTTNLDVTIQAQYLDLLKELQEQTGVAIIFVTHNLGIVARMCDKLAVMYAGKIVEAGSVRELFNARAAPLHEGAARLDAEARQQGEAARDPRPAARSRDLAAGLRLPPALPRGAAVLRQRRAARGDASAGPGRRGAGAPNRTPDIADRCQERRRTAMSPPLLEIDGLTKHFPVTTALFPRRQIAWVKAVDGIDFAVDAGRDAWASSASPAAARPRPRS